MRLITWRNLRYLIPVFIISILVLSDFLSDSSRDLPTREMNARINPQVYLAFRRIEIHAYEYIMRDEVNRKEYERCKEVLAALEDTARKENKFEYYSQSAQEWYSYLQSLGFELPSLYLDRRPTKEELETTKILQDELESKLFEIMIKYFEFMSKEIQERSDSIKSKISESRDKSRSERTP